MKKSSCIKCFALFFITFALGFGINKLNNSSNSNIEVFSKEQAISHLNKKVQSLCNAKTVSVEDTKGRTVFVDKNDWRGDYSVVIDWEHSIRGKHELIWNDKENYQKCIVEVGEIEQ
jgi:hypothetical protein